MMDIQAVVFRVQNDLYAIDTEEIDSIVLYKEPKPLKKTPKFVSGVIELRGNNVPIVNFKMKVQLNNTDVNKHSNVLVTRTGDSFMGIVVDEVLEIMKFQENNVSNTPNIVTSNFDTFIKCIIKNHDKLIPVLDVNSILNEKERKATDKAIKALK
jgi:purine-binding chemotaxis protein CheW